MTAHKRRHTTQPFALCKLSYTNDGREDGLNDMVNHKAHFLYVFGTASMP